MTIRTMPGYEAPMATPIAHNAIMESFIVNSVTEIGEEEIRSRTLNDYDTPSDLWSESAAEPAPQAL